MIIPNRAEIKIDHWIYRALSIELLLSLFCFFAILTELLSLPSPNDVHVKRTISKRTSFAPLDQVALETGPFSLVSLQHSKLIPPLDAEVVILGRNTRPDAHTTESNLLIGLRSAKQKKLVENGEKIYLHFDEAAGNTLSFSENKTALSFRPLILDMDSVLLEAHIAIKEQKGMEEKAQFIIKDQNIGYDPLSINEGDPAFLREFKQGKFFGKDLFLEAYGDEQERIKFKIRFVQSEDSYFYVHPGSYLIYGDGQWKSPEKGILLKDYPIAKVLDGKENYIDCVVWDQSGYQRWHLKIPREMQTPFKPKIEEIISSVKLRTRTQVSLRMGKSRVTVREGDWLLKTDLGWKKLKKLEEIDEYLADKLLGDLIVFDKIEKKNNEYVLVGSCFDPKRVQMHKISIPVVQEKKVR